MGLDRCLGSGLRNAPARRLRGKLRCGLGRCLGRKLRRWLGGLPHGSRWHFRRRHRGRGRRGGRRRHRLYDRPGAARAEREGTGTLRGRKQRRRSVRCFPRRLVDRSLLRGDLGGRRTRLLAGRLLRVGIFRLADQLVGLFLRHLPAAHHVLHQVARALDGEPRQPGGGADHVLHGGRNLAASFLTDELRPLGHLGNGVAHVRAAMARSATWGWCGRSGRHLLGRLVLVHHVAVRSGAPGEGLPVSLKAALRRANLAIRGARPGLWRQVYDFSTATQGSITRRARQFRPRKDRSTGEGAPSRH